MDQHDAQEGARSGSCGVGAAAYSAFVVLVVADSVEGGQELEVVVVAAYLGQACGEVEP